MLKQVKFIPLILLFIGLNCTKNSGAQVISLVNFDLIKDRIMNRQTPYFYPRMLARLNKKDTSLNHIDYHHLYYGSVFLKGYQPYGISNLKKSFLDTYEDKNYKKAVSIGENVLKENPVDLEVLLKLSISHLELGNDVEKRAYAIQYFSFLDVIYRSGTGSNFNSAYVVISVDHEYFILSDLGLTAEAQYLENDCDVLKIKRQDQPKIKGKKKIKELYFNVKQPLMSLSKTYKDVDLPEPDED